MITPVEQAFTAAKYHVTAAVNSLGNRLTEITDPDRQARTNTLINNLRPYIDDLTTLLAEQHVADNPVTEEEQDTPPDQPPSEGEGDGQGA